MQEMICEIEQLTGSKVYVGRIAGTDTPDLWATVEYGGYVLQCPAETEEQAVADLLAWVQAKVTEAAA